MLRKIFLTLILIFSLNTFSYGYNKEDINKKLVLSFISKYNILDDIKENYNYIETQYKDIKKKKINYNKIYLTEEEKKKMKIFFDVYKTLLNNHYDNKKLDKNKLLYSSIEGLADGTDDQFSVYFPPSEAKDFEESLNGEFEGIGSYVEMEKLGVLKIISPIVGSPSEKAGIKGGDIIIKIDDTEITKEINISDAIKKIKGPAGTKVKLKILRDGKTFDIEIIREKIIIKNVEYKVLENEFFYIQMKMFGDKVLEEFEKSLDEASKSGLKKIIFDLRNNPGGYLDQVKNILSLLVKAGEKTAVIKYKDYKIEYYSDGVQKLNLGDFEVYILINSGTASASEIMVGTLKDYFPNIKIIGEKSYGKGSVQTIKTYYDGSSLKYTVAKWFTGKNEIGIDKIGIKPDIEIILDTKKFSSGEDNQLNYILTNY